MICTIPIFFSRETLNLKLKDEIDEMKRKYSVK